MSRLGLNTLQTEAARMLASGLTEEQVLARLFFINEDTPSPEKAKARRTLHKWMDLPGFIDVYKATVRHETMSYYGRAVNTIGSQLDSDQPWLANKAANDILSRGATVFGEEDKKIVVQIEGMPELGTPDDA